MARQAARRFFIAASTGSVAGFLLSGCDPGTGGGDHPARGTLGGVGKETDGRRFVQFLKDCTPAERVQLAQSLHMLPAIEKADFGRFGLPGYGEFADDAKTASSQRPVRPASFNEVPPEVVLDAIKSRHIDAEVTTPYKILSALTHTCFNEAIAATINRDAIDYHAIVQWVARKKGVGKTLIDSATTFDLEQAIAKQCLAALWDRLDPEQRKALLVTIEKKTGTTIADKAAIAAMGGGAAVAALGATVAMAGFAFYTTMTVMISTAAGMLGIALPMSAYVGASSAVALLAGPIGWLLATIGILGGLAYIALPNADKTAAFVMTMNVIKASRMQAELNK
jgi:hypothetical protein